MPLEGQQIGRYRLTRLLGSGGMGDVYLAVDARIEQQVAIKVMRAEASSSSDRRTGEEAARLFLREARAIAKLDHPNILPLFDFGEEQIGDTTIMYLVMPYRQEGSLANWLRHRAGGAQLTPLEVTHFVQQAGTALQHAHNRQVIHQDVKPSNFLLRSREDTHSFPDLLLADFGIARFMTATASASQAIRGTPNYMAPEQWEGEAVPATDQYALAVMIYELLTGKLPFQGGPGKMMYQHINVQPQPPSSLNASISKDIDTVLLKTLAKQPEQRFASIAIFANAFQQAAQGIQSVEERAHISNIQTVEKTIPPTALVEADVSAPTAPRSDIEPGGSDSETYVKPIDTPVPPTFTPPTPFHQEVLPVENTVPIATKNARQRRDRRRPLLIIALIALMLAAIGGGIAYALPMLFGNGAATVTITPARRDLINTFMISALTGNYDASQNQVQAHSVYSSTPVQKRTVNATGQGRTSGTYATGTITFSNATGTLAIPRGETVFENFKSNEYQIEATVTLQTTSPPVTVDAIATVPGSQSNIPASAINSTYCFGDISPNCSIEVDVQNTVPFTGGSNPQTYVAVQQSDIDNAANTLEKANIPANPLQVIQSQIRSNERLVSAPQCKPNVTSDHKAGDQASNVTVAVNFTCTGQVYNYDGARSLAAQLLKNQAVTDPGSNYALAGNINTDVISAILTNASQGSVALQVSAEGMWVYQFSAAQKQQLAQLIAGKSKQAASALLTSQPGVGNATIQLQGDNGTTLPTDPGKISIVIK